MKCPICSEVIRFKLTSKFIPTPYGVCFQKPEDQLKIETVPCKHCNGTGEIQEGDVWHIEIRSHVIGTLYYDYKQFDGESFGINSEFEVIPLYRMEKVK